MQPAFGKLRSPHRLNHAFYDRPGISELNENQIQTHNNYGNCAGVWGNIVVLEGQLKYIITEFAEEIMLTNGNPGVIEPTIFHEVEAIGTVRFHVEFYR